MEYVSAKEKAIEWNISLRRVQKFCKEKRIDGVQRIGKVWLIPKHAVRPPDMRYASNKTDENVGRKCNE